MRRTVSYVALCVAALLAVFPGASVARAQESPPPSSTTYIVTLDQGLGDVTQVVTSLLADLGAGEVVRT